jgi:hypothetical protein
MVAQLARLERQLAFLGPVSLVQKVAIETQIQQLRHQLDRLPVTASEGATALEPPPVKEASSSLVEVHVDPPKARRAKGTASAPAGKPKSGRRSRKKLMGRPEPGNPHEIQLLLFS